MSKQCNVCPPLNLRWLVGGFVGALVIVCYQLSAFVDQQMLLTYKEFLQHKVGLL
jgi:hypothetical protein